jgi:ABC-type multidrug transport system permease subunit
VERDIAVILRDDVEAGAAALKLFDEITTDAESSADYAVLDADIECAFTASYSTQLSALYRRAFKNSRAELFTFLTVFRTVSVALICGLMWFRMPRTEKTIPDRGSFVFFYQLHWFFTSLYTGILLFIPERIVLQKERAAGTYNLSAYFISKNLSELPVIITLPTLFLSICYPMANMNHSVKSFFGLLFTQLLGTMCAESIGLFIGTAFIDLSLSFVVATIIILLFLLVGGFWVDNIPVFMLWLKAISPISYTFETCLQFEFTGSIPCDGSHIIPECATQTMATREQILHGYFNVESDSIPIGIGMLVVISLFFRFAAYLSLRFLQCNKGRA